MSRRDAFSSLRQPGFPNPEGNLSNGGLCPDAPKQPLDLIPVAPTRKKRNRDWDRAHQSEKITYRGIPQSNQDAVNELAESLGVPRDELVRAIFEFALLKVQIGALTIQPHPKAQRMTLFPEKGHPSKDGPGTNSYREWLSQAFPKPSTKQISRSTKHHTREQKPKERWEVRATYRLPEVLKAQVKALADEHYVPVGEIALLFLDYGLGAYHSGELALTPSPQTTGQTLFPER
jgi:hypothetical protein